MRAQEAKEEETKETDEPPEKEPEEEPRVDFDKLDVFGVEDVLNVGDTSHASSHSKEGTQMQRIRS